MLLITNQRFTLKAVLQDSHLLLCSKHARRQPGGLGCEWGTRWQQPRAKEQLSAISS